MATRYRDRPHSRPQPQSARPQQAPAVPEISLQPDQPVYDKGPLDEIIRTRAYYLWEQAGRPGGDGRDFWIQAEREVGNHS